MRYQRKKLPKRIEPSARVLRSQAVPETSQNCHSRARSAYGRQLSITMKIPAEKRNDLQPPVTAGPSTSQQSSSLVGRSQANEALRLQGPSQNLVDPPPPRQSCQTRMLDSQPQHPPPTREQHGQPMQNGVPSASSPRMYAGLAPAREKHETRTSMTSSASTSAGSSTGERKAAKRPREDTPPPNRPPAKSRPPTPSAPTTEAGTQQPIQGAQPASAFKKPPPRGHQPPPPQAARPPTPDVGPADLQRIAEIIGDQFLQPARDPQAAHPPVNLVHNAHPPPAHQPQGHPNTAPTIIHFTNAPTQANPNRQQPPPYMNPQNPPNHPQNAPQVPQQARRLREEPAVMWYERPHLDVLPYPPHLTHSYVPLRDLAAYYDPSGPQAAPIISNPMSMLISSDMPVPQVHYDFHAAHTTPTGERVICRNQISRTFFPTFPQRPANT